MLGVQNVKREETGQYGIVSATSIAPKLSEISGIVEKPKPEKAPSTLGVVGRYILTPRIFAFLDQLSAGVGKEIQLTDGIAALLNEETVYAYEFEGTRYDCGSKLGYLKATLAYGMKHPEVGAEFSAFLESNAAAVAGKSRRRAK